MKTGLPIALALGVITFSSPALASPTFYGVFKGGWTDLDYREIPSARGYHRLQLFCSGRGGLPGHPGNLLRRH